MFTYTSSSDKFTMTGSANASIAVAGAMLASVDLGGTTPEGTQTQGLVVQNGELVLLTWLSWAIFRSARST